jgi:hypothetical protein
MKIKFSKEKSYKIKETTFILVEIYSSIKLKMFEFSIKKNYYMIYFITFVIHFV